MANGMQLPPQFQSQQKGIERRRRIAQMLMQQALTPQQGQMAGRIYVPPGPLSAISRVAQAYFGGKGMTKADEEETALGERYQSGLADEMQRISSMRQGQPATTDAADNIEQPGQAPDPRGAITAALTSQYQPVQKMGELQHRSYENEMTRENDRQARMQERLMTLEARAQDRQAAAADRAAAAQQAQDLRRELAEAQRRFAADQAAQNRQFQGEQREADRQARAQAAMDRIREQARAKLDATAGKKDEAKQRVSVNLKALSDYYDELTNLGAMVDAEQGSTVGNISAFVRSSSVGQLAGKVFGTKEQSFRNQINQMRPLLLQEIRQASAMGARGLDSNKELEFYLQAATDPNRDIQSNRAAIQVLENAYGLSSKVTGVDESAVNALRNEFKAGEKQAPGGAGKAPEGVSQAEWDAMTPEDRALWQN